MRLNFRTGIFSILLCSVHSIQLNAQSILNKIEFGVQAGTLIYQGDLTPERFGSFRTPGIQLGISASMPLNNFISARANLSFGKLRGDDAKYDNPEWRQHRSLNFKSPVFEFTGLVVWDIMGNNPRPEGLSPYVFGGLGYSFLRVRRDASNFDGEYFSDSDLSTRLNNDLGHSTPTAILVLPVGAGLRYPLTDRLSLNAETSYRLAFNDYLDGFSQAGNSKQNDHYHSTSIGLFYKFIGSGVVKCPVVRP